MNPETGQLRPLGEAEIATLSERLGRPLEYGDRHPDTGEVVVSGDVAHAQQVGRSELSRRERRAQARAEKRRLSRLARGL
jgi:hypothetical protein